jgi:hypothetical protein
LVIHLAKPLEDQLKIEVGELSISAHFMQVRPMQVSTGDLA